MKRNYRRDQALSQPANSAPSKLVEPDLEDDARTVLRHLPAFKAETIGRYLPKTDLRFPGGPALAINQGNEEVVYWPENLAVPQYPGTFSTSHPSAHLLSALPTSIQDGLLTRLLEWKDSSLVDEEIVDEKIVKEEN